MPEMRGYRLKCCWECVGVGASGHTITSESCSTVFPQNTSFCCKHHCKWSTLTIAQFGEREKKERKGEEKERDNLIHLPMDELVLVLTCDSTNSSYLWVGAPQAAEAK